MCPLCAYNTLVWDDEDLPVCPNCDRSIKARLERKIHDPTIVFKDGGPVLLPKEDAEKIQKHIERLGVVVDR